MTPTTSLLLLLVTLVLGVAGLVTLDQGRLASKEIRARTLLREGTGVSPLRRWFDRMWMRTSLGQLIQRKLDAAGLTKVSSSTVGLFASAGAGVVVLTSRTLVTLPAAAVLAGVALFVAYRYLEYLVERRRAQFAFQLPDLARIMSNAAGAGMAIPNALGLAARELAEPAKSILLVAVRQMEVGQSLSGAMEEVERLVPSREMEVLVSTLVIQQRSGGDVIEALRQMSTNLEQRRDLKREVDSMMAGTKFTAYSVMSLGVFMLFAIEMISPGTLRRMTGTVAGILVLGVAGVLYVIGFILMRRFAQVEV